MRRWTQIGSHNFVHLINQQGSLGWGFLVPSSPRSRTGLVNKSAPKVFCSPKPRSRAISIGRAPYPNGHGSLHIGRNTHVIFGVLHHSGTIPSTAQPIKARILSRYEMTNLPPAQPSPEKLRFFHTYIPFALLLSSLLLLMGCNGITSPSRQQASTTIMASGTKLSFTPASVDFGVVGLDLHKTTQVEVLANVGNAAVKVGSVSVSPTATFAIQGWTGPVTLAPGASLHLRLIFAPQTTGEYPGILTISTEPARSTKSGTFQPVSSDGEPTPTPTPAPTPTKLTVSLLGRTQSGAGGNGGNGNGGGGSGSGNGSGGNGGGGGGSGSGGNGSGGGGSGNSSITVSVTPTSVTRTTSAVDSIHLKRYRYIKHSRNVVCRARVYQFLGSL